MQLETDEAKVYEPQIAAGKPKIKVGPIIIGAILITIPILITLFISVPELWQTIVGAKSEIIKGAFIGLSTLPVLLFVVIKGGKVWYKKWWAWLAFSVTIIAVVTISLVGNTQSAPADMGMEMQEMPMDKGMY